MTSESQGHEDVGGSGEGNGGIVIGEVDFHGVVIRICAVFIPANDTVIVIFVTQHQVAVHIITIHGQFKVSVHSANWDTNNHELVVRVHSEIIRSAVDVARLSGGSI